MRVIKVKGMSCDHCVKTVTKALYEIDGIENVMVDLSKNEASFDEKKPIDMEVVKGQVEKAGYEFGQ